MSSNRMSQDPFDWIEEIPHFGGAAAHDESHPGFVGFLKEKVKTKEVHIDFLHDQLAYNRKFRRIWRATAILALAALAVAVYHWGAAVGCAPL